MSKRHSDAIAIQEGACNPSGIVHSILAACQEIRDSGHFGGTADITSDPAVRLMVHQLAYICQLDEIDTHGQLSYESAYSLCLSAIAADKAKALAA